MESLLSKNLPPNEVGRKQVPSALLASLHEVYLSQDEVEVNESTKKTYTGL